MAERILVYVAGPYRGACDVRDARTPWDVEENVRRAEVHGLALARAGDGRLVPVIPHTMYRYFDRQLSDEFWLEATMELLRRCDAIAVAPGWEKSVGTAGELADARARGIPVFQERFVADQAAAILDWFASRTVDVADLATRKAVAHG